MHPDSRFPFPLVLVAQGIGRWTLTEYDKAFFACSLVSTENASSQTGGFGCLIYIIYRRRVIYSYDPNTPLTILHWNDQSYHIFTMSTLTLTQLEPSKKRGASISNASSGKKRKISEQHHSQLAFHPAAPTRTTSTLLNPPSAPRCNNTTVSHEPGQINARSVTADDVSGAFDLSPVCMSSFCFNFFSVTNSLIRAITRPALPTVSH